MLRVDLTSEPGPEWDAFVSATPEAALGQAAGWASVLRDAYGLAPRYLGVREDGGELVGVLPLALFRSLGGRRELVSLPFLDAAGIAARSMGSRAALLESALHFAREHAVDALELREPAAPAPAPARAPGAPRVDLVLPLAADEEAQWRSLSAKVRNQTRKAQREGLRIAAGSPEVLRRGFYRVFRVNMRDLGSPVHSERFFATAAARFGSDLRFIVATRDDRPVGGLVAIRYGGTVSVPWASTLRSERARCPNNLIYWEALRWAIAEGATRFDFGRSPRESGSYRFKRGWGAEERPLAWTRLAPDGTALPLRRAGDSAVLRRLSRLWTALPVPVSAAVGPRLRRFLSE
jgi:FemAB-related protein (PEP-CTERM system-associated)